MNSKIKVKSYILSIVLLSILLVVAGCTKERVELKKTEYKTRLYDYSIQLIVYSNNLDIPPKVFLAVESKINELYNTWFNWRKQRGLLSQINTAFSNSVSIRLNKDQLSYIKKLQEISSRSGYKINPVTSLGSSKLDMSDIIVSNDSIRATNKSLRLKLEDSFKEYLLDEISAKASNINPNKTLISIDNMISLVGHGEELNITIDNESKLNLCSGEVLVSQDNIVHPLNLEFNKAKPYNYFFLSSSALDSIYLSRQLNNKTNNANAKNTYVIQKSKKTISQNLINKINKNHRC